MELGCLIQASPQQSQFLGACSCVFLVRVLQFHFNAHDTNVLMKTAIRGALRRVLAWKYSVFRMGDDLEGTLRRNYCPILELVWTSFEVTDRMTGEAGVEVDLKALER